MSDQQQDWEYRVWIDGAAAPPGWHHVHTFTELGTGRSATIWGRPVPTPPTAKSVPIKTYVEGDEL